MYKDSDWLRKVLGTSFEIGSYTGVLVIVLIVVISGYVTGKWGPIKKALEHGEKDSESGKMLANERPEERDG